MEENDYKSIALIIKQAFFRLLLLVSVFEKLSRLWSSSCDVRGGGNVDDIK